MQSEPKRSEVTRGQPYLLDLQADRSSDSEVPEIQVNKHRKAVTRSREEESLWSLFQQAQWKLLSFQNSVF